MILSFVFGRIYTFNHELKGAMEGWKETLNAWRKSIEELEELEKQINNKQ